MSSPQREKEQTRVVRHPIRRSPRYGPFMAVPAVVLALIGGVWTLARPIAGQYTLGSVLAYTCLVLAFVGAMLGGLVAMLLDRRR